MTRGRKNMGRKWRKRGTRQTDLKKCSLSLKTQNHKSLSLGSKLEFWHWNFDREQIECDLRKWPFSWVRHLTLEFRSWTNRMWFAKMTIFLSQTILVVLNISKRPKLANNTGWSSVNLHVKWYFQTATSTWKNNFNNTVTPLTCFSANCWDCLPWILIDSTGMLSFFSSRVSFSWKLTVGISRMWALFHSRWQTLGIPSALIPIGQLYQSPPSPVPGDRARSKWRDFSPRAAARHSAARGFSPAAAVRHPKFGIPVRGFLRCIVFLGVPWVVLFLVPRSLLCSGSCPFSLQKTRFFKKISGSSRRVPLTISKSPYGFSVKPLFPLKKSDWAQAVESEAQSKFSPKKQCFPRNVVLTLPKFSAGSIQNSHGLDVFGVLLFRETYGQAQGRSGGHQGRIVHVSCLLWAGSGIYGVRYLRAIGYLSVSQCVTGPAKESRVCIRWPRMEENKPAHLILLHDKGDSLLETARESPTILSQDAPSWA